MSNLLHHELLDRLYLITDMFNDYIVEHDSNDILSHEEKQQVCQYLWNLYQTVGERIYEKEQQYNQNNNV